MSKILKPCPFCGNQEKVRKNGANYAAWCTNDECKEQHFTNLKIWQNAFCWREIERLQKELKEEKQLREEQYQAFQKWKKNYFKERDHLKILAETKCDNHIELGSDFEASLVEKDEEIKKLKRERDAYRKTAIEFMKSTTLKERAEGLVDIEAKRLMEGK